jgi:hypothetical protein
MLLRCLIILLILLFLYLDDGGRLITTLSTTSAVTSFMSWVLAEDITAERGIPFLSVKMCRFAWPSLLLSVVRLFPTVIAPPKGDFIDIESIDCHHVQLIPIIISS